MNSLIITFFFLFITIPLGLTKTVKNQFEFENENKEIFSIDFFSPRKIDFKSKAYSKIFIFKNCNLVILKDIKKKLNQSYKKGIKLKKEIANYLRLSKEGKALYYSPFSSEVKKIKQVIRRFASLGREKRLFCKK